MKKSIYISTCFFLLLNFTLHCRAQEKVYVTTIDLSEPKNAMWIKSPTDKIGDILLDGYMSGKLRGYSEGIIERLEYAPVPPEHLPREWKKGQDYWVYDLVSYQGQYYECWDDDADPNLPPLNNKQWHAATLEGDLISQKWVFPEAQDTLSKVELLDRMTTVLAERFMSWQSGTSYFAGDLVEYGGYNYQAMSDVTGSTPPADDKVNWVYHPTSVMFARPFELNIVEIFSWVEKRTLLPQIIGLKFLRPEGFDQRVIYFYYEEALNYLNHIRQPILYKNPYGYIGANELVMDEQSRINLLQQIKTLAKTKPKTVIAGVVDQKMFSDFQRDTAGIVDLSRWRIMQSLDGSTLQLSEDGSEPFLTVPISAIKKILSKEKVTLATYAGMIQSGKFDQSLDAYPDAPESPRIKGPEEVARIPRELCFMESYIKVLDSLSDLKMQELWKKAVDINKTKPIRQIHPLRGFFPSHYDWSKQVYHLPSKGDFQFDKTFQIGYDDEAPFVTDTLATATHVTRYSVTYEKSAGKFVPLDFTISIEAPDSYFSDYTFEWKTIQPVLASFDPELVSAIEKGTVKYSYSELQYGLVEK